ncbi:PTS system glucitol/sorbitol-specific transporter subunit IIA [Leminorella richardii]|uniref:PTS system glucitol/sorbitol-specific transporter subunit IIA n=1 Tax=Leminorella richardii TaxID=158841 RepID=A0A2X4XKX6_9GAMM|nr:PTS glucitol/sorbitol transporter subunit IIA [Leminorella richardii]SQI37264.1 PTS system glucitol/sorbitol-specific transporter subunit IIA [Leminorella richardii]
MKQAIWRAQISAVGKEAAGFLSEGRIILFSDQAPQDLIDYCLVHGGSSLTKPIAVGQHLELYGKVYPITAVGEVASQNLEQLGHITLQFDGATQPELPGTVHLDGSAPSRLDEQGEIVLFEED